MVALLEAGYVTPSGQDVLPSTGEHLDVRVMRDGKYVDPGTIRSLLTRLKVGKEKKPLWQQQGEEWKPSFPITSGFGQRKAPTKGASSYHPAHDYGIAGNTPLFWEGPGTFKPGRGLGTISTTDAQGRPYEVHLLHTKGGKASSAPAAQAPTQPAVTQPQAPSKVGDTYIFVGGKRDAGTSNDFLASYIQQSLMGNTPEIRSSIDPAAMLMQAFNQTPNYLA